MKIRSRFVTIIIDIIGFLPYFIFIYFLFYFIILLFDSNIIRFFDYVIICFFLLLSYLFEIILCGVIIMMYFK
uniref:Uncharacterized protein n=1 Tax=Strigamia maritima TaxID=126957 RepID=T1ILF6_STRMM